MNQTEIVVLFAIFGGLAVNLLRLVERRQKKVGDLPNTKDYREAIDYIQFIVLPLLGGGLAMAYQASGTPLTPILAVNIGACAPLILKTLSSELPGQQQSVDRGAHEVVGQVNV